MPLDVSFTGRAGNTPSWQEDDELAHIEDTLRSEPLVFGFTHLVDGCTCHGKLCSMCHTKQCCHAFGPDKRSSDGRYGHCYSCKRISKNNSRARRKKIATTITPQQWLDLKARYDYRCLCCGRQEPDITLTVDHVIPLSKGGPNAIENAQPLCLVCNKNKSVRSTDYRLFNNLL